MRGSFALSSEILRRADDADAEVGLPDPIDEHSRSGRRFWVRQPFGKSQPREGRVGRQWVQHRWNPWSHRIGRFKPVAALEHVGFALLFASQQREGS